MDKLSEMLKPLIQAVAKIDGLIEDYSEAQAKVEGIEPDEIKKRVLKRAQSFQEKFKQMIQGINSAPDV